MTRVLYLARMEGFEPPTTWFVARYSIQLSYMRVSLLKSVNAVFLRANALFDHYVCTAERNVIKLTLNRKCLRPFSEVFYDIRNYRNSLKL